MSSPVIRPLVALCGRLPLGSQQKRRHGRRWFNPCAKPAASSLLLLDSDGRQPSPPPVGPSRSTPQTRRTCTCPSAIWAPRRGRPPTLSGRRHRPGQPSPRVPTGPAHGQERSWTRAGPGQVWSRVRCGGPARRDQPHRYPKRHGQHPSNSSVPVCRADFWSTSKACRDNPPVALLAHRAIDHFAHGGIVSKPIRVIRLLIARDPHIRRLADQRRHRVLDALAPAHVTQLLGRHLGQTEPLVKLPVGQQPGVAGVLCPHEANLHRANKTNPQSGVISSSAAG